MTIFLNFVKNVNKGGTKPVRPFLEPQQYGAAEVGDNDSKGPWIASSLVRDKIPS